MVKLGEVSEVISVTNRALYDLVKSLELTTIEGRGSKGLKGLNIQIRSCQVLVPSDLSVRVACGPARK
jgi:hypothetical protein